MNKPSVVNLGGVIGAVAVLTLAGCTGAKEEADRPASRAVSRAAPEDSVSASASSDDRGTTSTPAQAVGMADPGSLRAIEAAATPPLRSLQPSARPGGAEDSPGLPTSHAVSYRDDPGDATGGTGQHGLSQAPFDILRVGWTPLLDGGSAKGYSTSITVAGIPRDDGAYVSYGVFPSDVAGEQCQLYNILIPGTTAIANGFCGRVEDGSRRFIGRIEGSLVSVVSADGGWSLSATFEDPVLPRQLEAGDRTLYDLAAFTALCTRAPSSPEQCVADEVLDEATSTMAYRI